MKFTKPALLGLATLFLSSAAQAQYNTYDVWEKNYTVQALLGAVQYENLKFDVEGTAQETDLSLLPQFGGAWGTVPKAEHRRHWWI